MGRWAVHSFGQDPVPGGGGQLPVATRIVSSLDTAFAHTPVSGLTFEIGGTTVRDRHGNALIESA